MGTIARCELPDGALLQSYAAKGAYTDFFAAEVAARVSLASYVEAFYTSAAFRPERLVLALIGKASNDADVRRLARDDARTFAAWNVEARAPDQILLCDFLSRTRSWLMVEQTAGEGSRLYFGSAVVPVGMGSGRARLGFPFNAMVPFHQFYSRVLLSGARGRVLRLAAAGVRRSRQTNDRAQ
ncbi:MAG: hypothetical protein R3C30_08790 [Hyphomonadaceae bacterium]